MLIKPFFKEKEDVDDIENIKQKNRYIFIYRYENPHQCSYSNIIGNFNGPSNLYDIYLINDSQVEGVGFYINKGISLQNRNCYRGYAKDLLLPDGKFNYEAVITFMNGTYLNKITPKLFKHDPDPITISSIDGLLTCGGPASSCFDEEIECRLGTDVIQPYPQFYNVEDQMWLSNKYKGLKIGDFLYDYSGCPTYTLRDLIDKYTKIAVIDIPAKGNIIDQSLVPYAIDPIVDLNNGKRANMESLKSTITRIFIDVFCSISHSIFSAIDIVIDLESGLFSVIPKSVKFIGVPKETIQREKLKIAFDISEKIDNVVEMTNDVPDELYINNLCPNRLSIHISNYNAVIRLTNIYQNTVTRELDGTLKKDHLGAIGTLSSSDSDDIVQVFAVGSDS